MISILHSHLVYTFLVNLTYNENATVVHDAMTLNAQARGTDLLLYEKFYSTEEGFDFGEMIKYITGQSSVDNTADNKQATDPKGTPVTPKQ